MIHLCLTFRGLQTWCYDFTKYLTYQSCLFTDVATSFGHHLLIMSAGVPSKWIEFSQRYHFRYKAMNGNKYGHDHNPCPCTCPSFLITHQKFPNYVRSAKDISHQPRTLWNHFVLLKLFSYGITEAIVVEAKPLLIINKFTCVLVSFKSTISFLVCVAGYLYILLCVLVLQLISYHIPQYTRF